MSREHRPGGERGAIIIHVAFALLALLAFTSFVVDYGIMWVSRRQAQNVADGAALAGAIGYMIDGKTFDIVNRSAQHFAANNPIWGQFNSAANVTVTLSGPPNLPQFDNIPPCGTDPGCVRVDVYRNMPDRYDPNTIRGNVLPTFFGRLVGVLDQGVRATATAETTAGNQVRCLLPFAVADRWSDSTDEFVGTYANDGLHLASPPNPIGGWSPNDKFWNGVDPSYPGDDTYVPPYNSGHTGWTVYGDANRPGDYGRQLILKDGRVSQFSAGWAGLVDLPNSIGGCDVLTNIRGCNETPVAIAEEDEDCSGFPNNTTTPEMAARGCLGIKGGGTNGPTKQGVEQPGGCDHLNDNVYDQDPGARWDPDYMGVGPNGMPGAVVNAAGQPNMDSPRIRPVAVFHISSYMQNADCKNQAGTSCVAKVVNIIGFFVEGICETVRDRGELDPGMACTGGSETNKEIVGRIVTLPSAFAAGAGNVTEESAFLMIVRLVR
jgi:hypothetical protein